ncbi:MAG TPA: YciI family protein [Candidatus Polarisedimenticolia bacterium]|jgi:uncharacterized protein YciI|nr:YciI family protein [Candidatus Polarisedimenticolia bacterium]
MKITALATKRAGSMALIMMLLVSGAAGANKKGQPAAPASPKLHYLIRLKPARPEGAASDEEKARILLHFDYLKTLQAKGKLVLAGMSTDDFTGIVVVEATGQMEAERIMLADPAVSGNVYLAELHPFQLALRGSPR